MCACQAETSRLACDVNRFAMYMLSPQQPVLWLSKKEEEDYKCVVNFRHVPHEYESVTTLYTDDPGCEKGWHAPF
jgi:hypothetical protein